MEATYQPRTLPWPSLPADIRDVLEAAPSLQLVGSTEELLAGAVPEGHQGWHDITYDVEGVGRVVEAQVCRVRNGIAVNYPEPYIRRRDPDCMVIGDDLPSDQPHFVERFGEPFEPLRRETLDWLATQELACFAFVAGQGVKSLTVLAVCPANAGFFALGLAMLQGIVPVEEWADIEAPSAFLLVAPPFRHTRLGGKQVVVHRRTDDIHELFSYNLYPGPSAKKGVYGMLLHRGASEGWVTAHCSTVKVVTPYDNHVVIMHEGASGGGKSEMLQYPHREADGRLLLGRNRVTRERRFLTLPRGCELQPVTDDMALCHRTIRGRERKLQLCDAERAWFVRVNHIEEYGTDPYLEKLTVQPPEPLLFLNIDAVPGSRALIWEHTEDAPGVACPNPRVILPRHIVSDIVDGDVTVDIRSFGVRTPPCTRENPSYGILGLFHVLPPALAWLWRLASPRGHDNPSIVQRGGGIPSEGVGSFWPFATGLRVEYANLLLRQILATPDTLYVLAPNQNIGAWKVDFMPQWLVREYLARRGSSRFRDDQLMSARCSLLGRTVNTLHIEGTLVSNWFLQVETQPEVGVEAYDRGADILRGFFAEQLALYRDEEGLDPIGREIIDCCLRGGSVEDYDGFTIDEE